VPGSARERSMLICAKLWFVTKRASSTVLRESVSLIGEYIIVVQEHIGNGRPVPREVCVSEVPTRCEYLRKFVEGLG
jgi:hypothetical protein